MTLRNKFKLILSIYKNFYYYSIQTKSLLKLKAVIFLEIKFFLDLGTKILFAYGLFCLLYYFLFLL